eukprot:TRINITY_DN43658_c0_g1_i1.p1 TRINITY_DN43658_c0_g1~~TRINITY_DN43658_c0_g1_i1.p1  ORF type:complete len:957 (+),score=200.09 TRINITY_DN43658_c0_g1_i1:199-3069(+)
MASTLVLGQLVEVTGKLEAPSACPELWFEVYEELQQALPTDVTGQWGQLVECEQSGGEPLWLVATLQGAIVPAHERSLRALATKDVDAAPPGFDVVLGPRSELEVLGGNLAELLQSRGYALCKIFASPSDLENMVSTAMRGASEGLFDRLPEELEPCYLGKDTSGRTMHLDMQASSLEPWMRESSLKIADRAISMVGKALRPFADSEFGVDIYSRSSTLLMLPFDGDEELYPQRSCENKEAYDFLTMMRRSRLQTIVNAGPSTATLKLIPKTTQGGDQEVTVSVKPGTLVVFDIERFKFAYTSGDQSLVMHCWYLGQQTQFDVSNLEGDLSMLGSVGGAPMPKSESVALVAMAMRYAFGIDEPWKLWLGYGKAAIDVFTEFPLARWDPDLYYDPDADPGSGKSYTKHGGFSEGIEFFDNRFFDISPAEARGMDPTQRQVLEVSYMSLEGGGYNKKDLARKSEQIGVFVGLDKNEWTGLVAQEGAHGASNSANSITSNRFSFCLNLKGPSMTIDTACSASLVASHTAKLYLLNKAVDPCVACITTGVNLLLSPLTFIACCGAGMLSRKGRCFTYDAGADGYARGEGTVSHCMKRKPWDREAGDLALLAGSNANQDGRSASLTAPNGPAQERVSLSVLKEAGITAADVDACECHGTGTALGDPIELGAYKKVMKTVKRDSPILITSCKTNIGHCEGSAGIGGLIKCVLMVMHAEGTSNCHFRELNPHIDMDGFYAQILSETIPLRSDSSYCGVLSFGFGGTNASAQVWGQNTVTSRGSGKGDMYQRFIQKIQTAAAPEVIVTGDDWEHWQVEGPDPNSKPGESWRLELQEDGSIAYTRNEDEEVPDLGGTYYVTGSFNDWTMEAMEPDELLAGLHKASVEVGSSGQLLFQVLADQDPEMTFHPTVPSCTTKSAKVCGPAAAARESSWCIKGKRGDRFCIEFYRSEADALSISWRRLRQ